MEAKLARPGVQYGGDAEPAPVASESEQRFRRGPQQQLEHQGAVAAGQAVQLGGQREDDVEVIELERMLASGSVTPSAAAQCAGCTAMALRAGVARLAVSNATMLCPKPTTNDPNPGGL